MVNDMDRVRLDVHLASVDAHMQEMICGALEGKKADIKRLIDQTFREFDFDAYFKQEAERALRATVSGLVQRAFKIEWEFEKELQVKVRELLKARIEKAAADE